MEQHDEPPIETQRSTNAGMFDPDSKTTQLILWLYSMEPSLSWHIDNISKEMRLEHLDTLGLFSRSLYCILGGAEMKRQDKL